MAHAAANSARKDAKSKPTGWCGQYVRNALESAGFNVPIQHDAYQYHTNGILKSLGFVLISEPPYPIIGDICVTNKTPEHSSGHIAIFDGQHWVSDFIQKFDNVYSGVNEKYYYRVKYPQPVTAEGERKRCGRCGENVSPNEHIVASDRVWHRECFKCVQCNNIIPNTGIQYYEFDHKVLPICPSCYRNYFQPRCSECGKPIDGSFVKVKGYCQVWCSQEHQKAAFKT